MRVLHIYSLSAACVALVLLAGVVLYQHHQLRQRPPFSVVMTTCKGYITREGNHPLDTWEGDVYLLGWSVTGERAFIFGEPHGTRIVVKQPAHATP